MPTYKVSIFANNEAGTWASWTEKIAAIKAFYASVCNLDITLTPTILTPQFAPYEPSSGSSSVYRVDEAWYENNIIPLAAGADIVMLVIPPTDHPNLVTLMGLDYFQQGKIGETTVFSDETSHTYINEIDQGETFVVYAEHELSHQFYGLLAKTDNTHLYFYGGNPSGVLADFDFNEQELSWYQQAAQDLEQELGILKARQITPIADTAPQNATLTPATAPQNSNPTTASFTPKILAWAAAIGKEEGADPSLDNPGDLKLSDLTKSWGALQGIIASDGGFIAKFPTEQAGEVALCDFLVLGCQNELLAFHSPAARTLAGFMQIFAGNPPAAYTTAIVQAMGGDPNIQISTFLS